MSNQNLVMTNQQGNSSLKLAECSEGPKAGRSPELEMMTSTTRRRSRGRMALGSCAAALANSLEYSGTKIALSA